MGESAFGIKTLYLVSLVFVYNGVQVVALAMPGSKNVLFHFLPPLPSSPPPRWLTSTETQASVML